MKNNIRGDEMLSKKEREYLERVADNQNRMRAHIDYSKQHGHNIRILRSRIRKKITQAIYDLNLLQEAERYFHTSKYTTHDGIFLNGTPNIIAKKKLVHPISKITTDLLYDDSDKSAPKYFIIHLEICETDLNKPLEYTSSRTDYHSRR